MDLIFQPIQKRHLPLAYTFLRDALQISFGENSSKWPHNLGHLAQSNYIQIIEKKLQRDPSSVIHAWLNNEIIGQIESSVKKNDSACGYVSLYYLVAEKRRLGLGKQLDEFAAERFIKLGCERIELTVEPTNAAALNFYQKHGWINKGLHPSYEDGLLMEKLLTK